MNYHNLFKLIYAIDADKWAAATAKSNHQSCFVETKDIRNTSPNSIKKDIGLKDVDVIIGGPPCQGFSSLRPFRSSSVQDERNNLFLEFVSFVDFFRPKVVVMENVVGLVTHNSGRTLDKIITRFDLLGYNTEWKILNAACYGVPQKRERFIMIAARDRSDVVFPTPTHHFSGKVIGHKDKNRHIYGDDTLPPALTLHDAISDLPTLKRGQYADKYKKTPINIYQKSRRKGSNRLTLHRAANHSDKMMEVIKHSGDNINSIPEHLITSGFSSCYSRLNGDEPSTTITVKFQSPASSKCIHPTQHRTISPREAARIQSFDDTFNFEGSLTNIASQIGNAVPPLLGREVASAVSEMLA